MPGRLLMKTRAAAQEAEVAAETAKPAETESAGGIATTRIYRIGGRKE